MILSVSMINKKRGEDAAAERLMDGSPHDGTAAAGRALDRGAGGNSAEPVEKSELDGRAKRREMRALLVAASAPEEVSSSIANATDADGERDAAAAVGEGKGEDGGEGNTTVPNDADRYEPPPPRPPNPVLFVGDIISSNMARAYYAGIVLKDIYGCRS